MTIEPRLPRFPELWVGGGSKIHTSLSPDKPNVMPAVLARIAAADGWLARAAGSQEMVEDDVRAVRDYCGKVGRNPDSLRDGHLNFAHLGDTSDREEVTSSGPRARSSSASATSKRPACRTWSWRRATTISSSSSASRPTSSAGSIGLASPAFPLGPS